MIKVIDESRPNGIATMGRHSSPNRKKSRVDTGWKRLNLGGVWKKDARTADTGGGVRAGGDDKGLRKVTWYLVALKELNR